MDNLTPAQQEIIDYWEQHPLASNYATAKHLNKSINTLKNQIKSIYSRMGIPTQHGNCNMSRIVLYARLGWITAHEIEDKE